MFYLYIFGVFYVILIVFVEIEMCEFDLDDYLEVIILCLELVDYLLSFVVYL